LRTSSELKNLGAMIDRNVRPGPIARTSFVFPVPLFSDAILVVPCNNTVEIVGPCSAEQSERYSFGT